MTRDDVPGRGTPRDGVDGGAAHGAAADGGAPDEAELDALDATPLDPTEAATGAAIAGAATGESLADVVERVLAGLGTVARTMEPEGTEAVAAGGIAFAAHGGGMLEVALDGPVARAALATPEATVSTRGPGWVRFEPRAMDRYAADRAEAWLRYAHRRAVERSARR